MTDSLTVKQPLIRNAFTASFFCREKRKIHENSGPKNHKLRTCDIGHSAAPDGALEKVSLAGYKDSAPTVPITSRTAHDEFRCPSAMEEQRSSTVFPAPRRLYVPFENPNGIPAFSPAVARH